MERIVLDASALLAMFLREPGGDQIEGLLQDPELAALMSTLNWSEVFDRLLREGYLEHEVDRLLAKTDIEIVDFTKQQAKIAVGYRLKAPALSLGDRACLAVAAIKDAIAWTADRQWFRAKLPVRVHVLR
jgi:PIN domain nuclease of toxin-antitoxin system